MNIIFECIRTFLYVRKRIKALFWQWYHTRYCIVANVKFADRKSVKFNDHAVITINPESKVEVGKAFIVNSGPVSGIGVTKSKISVGRGALLKIGDYVGISSTSLLVRNSLIIGNHVNVGGGTYINDSNHHSTDWRDRADRKQDVDNAKTAPIVIGDYVFIGARCMILKGVTIGEKTIIAAGSVVVRDIPANCIAGGNPCKVIKHIS